MCMYIDSNERTLRRSDCLPPRGSVHPAQPKQDHQEIKYSDGYAALTIGEFKGG